MSIAILRRGHQEQRNENVWPTGEKSKESISRCVGGGYWIQLLRLQQAFCACDCTYVSVNKEYASAVSPSAFFYVPDANREAKVKLAIAALKILFVVLWLRPNIVISTGAAHGYLAIRFAKIVGAKTMFIDSIANAEQLSLSGELAVSHADVMLTQWPELSDGSAIQYYGSVL